MDISNYSNVQAKPNDEYEPLPAGEYLCAIKASESKATKDGSGQYLELKVEVIDGPKKGRVIFDILNLVNRNPQAVAIAQKTLGEIKFVLGSVRDTSEWHGKPFKAVVGIKPAQGAYGPGNKITRYLPATSALPTQAPVPATATPAPSAPWRAQAQATTPAPGFDPDVTF